jgi:hypothetical protein
MDFNKVYIKYICVISNTVYADVPFYNELLFLLYTYNEILTDTQADISFYHFHNLSTITLWICLLEIYTKHFEV